MAAPFPLDNDWSLGMRRDNARDAIPSGSAWNLVNLIPATLQAPLRKRGGTTYADVAHGGVTQLGGLCWAPFTAGSKLIGITASASGALWDVLANVNIGATTVNGLTANPFFYRDKVIIPDGTGTALPSYWDRTTFGTIAGAYFGKYGGVFKDHAVLAGANATPNRLAFSNAADPTTWDLTLQVWDASFPLRGLGFLPSAILCFQESQTEIIRGSIPPPGGDFVMSKLTEVGLLGHASVSNWGNQVIWPAAEGVFMTDGTNVVDLTAAGGMTNYWRDSFLANYVPASNNSYISTGVYRNHLFVSVISGGSIPSTTTVVDTLVCDLHRRVWWRFSNFQAVSTATVHTSPEEMYIATCGDTGRVAKTSTVWAPAAANKNDADGTAVTWTLESAMHRGFMRLHRRWVASQAVQTWRALYLAFDMRDASADNPTIRLSILNDSPESSTYTDASAGTGQPPDPVKTTAWNRIRMLINHPSNGFAYKLQSSNASSDTRIYGVEAEYAGREGSRIR